jgi:hypothetical protein
MASPDFRSEPELVGAANQQEHSARLVLVVYTAVMASSRNERAAFDAAVQTYRGEYADLPEEEARRAVAAIICRKPWR